jgi:hypothetical protein
MSNKIYPFSTLKPGQIYKNKHWDEYIYIQKVGRKYFYFKRCGKLDKCSRDIVGWTLLTPKQTLEHKAKRI